MSAIVLNIRQNSKYNIHVSVLFGGNAIFSNTQAQNENTQKGELVWSI